MEPTIEVPKIIMPPDSGVYKVMIFQRMDAPTEVPNIYPRFGPTEGLEGLHVAIFQKFAKALGVDPRWDTLPSRDARFLFPEEFTQYRIRAAGFAELEFETRSAKFRGQSTGYPEYRFVAEDKELLELLLELSVEIQL